MEARTLEDCLLFESHPQTRDTSWVCLSRSPTTSKPVQQIELVRHGVYSSPQPHDHNPSPTATLTKANLGDRAQPEAGSRTQEAGPHLPSLPFGQRRGAAALALAVQAVVVTLGPVELGRWQVPLALAAHLQVRA